MQNLSIPPTAALSHERSLLQTTLRGHSKNGFSRLAGGRAVRLAARGLLLAALLAALCGALGCDRQSGSPRPTPSPPAPSLSASPSLPPDVAARNDAVAAYTGMWAAFAHAGETADYKSPELPRYATGEALTRLVNALRTNHGKKRYYRGRPILAPEVTAAEPKDTPTRVTILDCEDSRNWLAVDADGKPDGTPDPSSQRQQVEATVVKTGAVWKVSRFVAPEGSSC
ncbi:hypothetical protein [Cryptosporangium minutisporangium]|uniref:Secreted protein/lipoprotein n=1 Tax=Cryptosporangium minutisporangium TaxID=113569 RepID=A0ABP6T0X3_9ACTN